MKFLIVALAITAVTYAEETSTKEKRGILGGYGYGYSGLDIGLNHGIGGIGYHAPVVSAPISLGYGGYHGLGLGGLGYGGYVSKGYSAPIITKTIAPVVAAPIVKYAAPIVTKSYAAPVIAAPISLGYGSHGGYGGYEGYGGYGGGYGGYGYNKWW